MPRVLRVLTDTAGSTILGGGGPNTDQNNVSVIGDQVAGHGQSPHSNPTMVQGSSNVKSWNIGVCRSGDLASCGHTGTPGSPNVYANESGNSGDPVIDAMEEGDQELYFRPAARLSNSSPQVDSPPLPTPSFGDAIDQIPEKKPTPKTNANGSEEIIKAMNRAGITDPCMRAQIYAQSAHESGGFTKREEGLNYSATRLQEVWPSRYNAGNVANYANNPEAVANKSYGGRMGNGPESSGDGYKYRGRGFIQLTGKSNYASASRALGVDFVNNPDAAAQDPYASDLAVWYCTKHRPLTQPCDVLHSSKQINGSYSRPPHGLADRNSRYNAAINDTNITTYDPKNI